MTPTVDSRLEAILARLDAMERRSLGARAWDIVAKLTVAMVVAIASATIAQEVRLAKIESSRFSDRDGVALEARILSAFPGQQAWLREALADIKQQLNRMDERLRLVEQRGR